MCESCNRFVVMPQPCRRSCNRRRRHRKMLQPYTAEATYTCARVATVLAMLQPCRRSCDGASHGVGDHRRVGSFGTGAAAITIPAYWNQATAELQSWQQKLFLQTHEGYISTATGCGSGGPARGVGCTRRVEGSGSCGESQRERVRWMRPAQRKDSRRPSSDSG